MQTNNLRLELGGSWAFRQASKSAWAQATVPGNVHTDLMALGLLKDPHLGENEADVGWVEAADWVYRKKFDAPAGIVQSTRVRLVATGLDTYATVWLNGALLGRTQNMFVEHVFELKKRLKPKGNELLIRFDSPSRRLATLVKAHGVVPAGGDDARVYARKAQYSFGWDWGARLPTSGVFAPIYIEALPEYAVNDLHVVTLVATPKEARGKLRAEILATRAGRVTLNASLGPWSLRKSVALKKGLNKLDLPWRLLRPRLWWPRGYGEAHLYEAQLTIDGGSSARCKVGLRVIQLDRKKDKVGESFGFKVNGVAVYAKGANWIPPDSFLGRVTAERVQGLVAQAVQANMTMLRVWGGGLYESEVFYDACDKAGLLVWQDFPFACSEVPEVPWFVAEVKAEAVLALRRLRRHASLALWCGNNENQTARHDHWFRGREKKNWGLLFYDKVLPELCATHDATTPYWPGSPYGGKDPNSQEQGDRHHWWVWGQYFDYHDYRLDRGRFVSEFGFAALPNRGVIERAFSKVQRALQSRAMQMHDKVERGGALGRLAFYIMNNLPFAAGFDSFRYLSQVCQADALRVAIEHWRRIKPHNQGALVWQLNDCWPVTSWAVLDADDKPKLAYYRTKHAFDDALLSAVEAEPKRLSDKVGVLPLHASQEGGRCELWLTLDGTKDWQGSFSVERWGTRRKQASLTKGRVAVAAGRSVRLWSRERQACKITDPSQQYLVFKIRAKDGRERRTLLFFERPRRLSLPDSNVTVKARTLQGLTFVSLRAKALALSVELSAPVAGRFSDNGFDMLPGETRVVAFTPDQAGPIKGAWSARHLGS